METIYTGNVHVFGKNIDTDQIYPGKYLELTEAEDIKQHCLEGADPLFSKNVKYGDIIAVGTNFGCGSSREHAAISILNSGTSVVIAESFARIFYRNAINLALPLIVCKGITSFVKRNDKVSVNIKTGIIKNFTSGEEIRGETLSDYAMEILESGGIKAIFRSKLKKQ